MKEIHTSIFFFFLITFPPSTDAQIELWGKLDHWSAKSQSRSRHVQVPGSSGCASCWSITDVEAETHPHLCTGPGSVPPGRARSQSAALRALPLGPGHQGHLSPIYSSELCAPVPHSLGGRDESFQPSGTLTATQERPRPVPPSS